MSLNKYKKLDPKEYSRKPQTDYGDYVRSEPQGIPQTEGQLQMPAISEEHVYASSPEFKALIDRAANGDELSSDEQARVQAAVDSGLIPPIPKQDKGAEKGPLSPEEALLDRTKHYFMTGGLKAGVAKGAIDAVASVAQPILQAIEDEAAAEPWPVSPKRNLAENPMTPEEARANRVWQSIDPGSKALAIGRKTLLKASSGLIGFFTQTLDPIANPEKYGMTSGEAIEQTAAGLVDMIREAPDQVDYLASVMFGTENNPVSALAKGASAVTNLGEVAVNDKSYAELRDAAINHLYEHPESLPFALAIVRGVTGKMKSMRTDYSVTDKVFKQKIDEVMQAAKEKGGLPKEETPVAEVSQGRGEAAPAKAEAVKPQEATAAEVESVRQDVAALNELPDVKIKGKDVGLPENEVLTGVKFDAYVDPTEGKPELAKFAKFRNYQFSLEGPDWMHTTVDLRLPDYSPEALKKLVLSKANEMIEGQKARLAEAETGGKVKAGGKVSATSKSVRDHPQQAVIQGEQIRVVSKVGRNTRGEYEFSLSEWKATERHPNPNWAKKNLIESKTVGLEDQPGGPEQANRIRDAQVSAIDAAIKKSTVSPTKAVPTVPAMGTKPVAEGGAGPTVYHGTSGKEFGVFKDNEAGIFFSDNPTVASQYAEHPGMWMSQTPSEGARVRQATLDMKNPLVIDAIGKRHDNIPVPWQSWSPKTFGNLPKNAVSVRDAAKYAKDNGYDGLVVKNVIDTKIPGDKTKSTVYAVFSGKQVQPLSLSEKTVPKAKPVAETPVKKPPKQKTDIVTAFPEMDAARNLAHAKANVKVAEQALGLKTLSDAQRAVASADLAEAQAEVKSLQTYYDRLAEKVRTEGQTIVPTEARAGGAGAVNPFESLENQFARQLKKAEGDRETTDVPSFTLVRRPKDVGITAAIRTPTNVFGAVFGKDATYGKAAQSAMRDLAITERDIMIDAGRNSDLLDQALHVAKKEKVWGKKGETLYDHIIDPSQDGKLTPEVLKSVETIRGYMEARRQNIIDVKREGIREPVRKLVEYEYRRANDLTGKKLNEAQRAEIESQVEAAVKDRIPDDWGVKNYLPQMHPGNWDVWAMDGEKPAWVGAAHTPSEALTKAMEHYGNNPHLTPEAYWATGRAFKGADVVRIGQKRLHAIVNDIAKSAEGALSKEEVRDFLRGKIGTKEGKQKPFGSLKQRHEFEGYRKDITGVLAKYNQDFWRWRHLTELNRRIQPLLTQMRVEGRPNTANMIEGTFQHLWGRSPSVASALVDGTLQKIPGVRDHVRPMILERAMGHVKGGVVWGFLKFNPRFHLLNRLQRYQTTAPVLKGLPHTGEWRKGTQFYLSEEGKAAREKFGVKYLTGGKFLEGGSNVTSPQFREKFRGLAPETSNQEIAWATMYKKAIDMGLPEAAANDYAFLNGMVHTQFLHLKVDTPPILRGPITSSIFQFKRFPIKNIELGIGLLNDRNYPGFGKWIGANLLFGGAKAASKLGAGIGLGYLSLEAYKKVKEEFGENTADFMMWGLPSMIGLDMSYSMQMIDVPYGESIPEQIGNVVLGPAGSIATSAIKAAKDTKGSDPDAMSRAIKAVVDRVPGLSFVEALRALSEQTDSGEYQFKDPAGRLRFRSDLKNVIIKGLGGRSIDEAEIDLYAEAVTEITANRDQAIDHQVQLLLPAVIDGAEPDWESLYDWNELWPQFPMDAETVVNRLKTRYENINLDRLERLMKQAPAVIEHSEEFRRGEE